jgi:glycosyltransferase involved in cell wall biosynthesis
MGVVFNTMVKNESIMLDNILPIWDKYPIDYFIFYDDNSIDETCEIIEKHLDKDRFIILNDRLPKFNEGYQRQRMLDEARNKKFDFVFSIDADELLSSSIVNNFDSFLKNYESFYKYQTLNYLCLSHSHHNNYIIQSLIILPF